MRNGLKIVNPILFVSASIQAFTGLWLFWRDSEIMVNIHKYNALLLIVLIAIHIALNWNWVKAVFLKRVAK